MSNIRIKESQLRLLEDYVSDNRLERIGDEKAELENYIEKRGEYMTDITNGKTYLVQYLKALSELVGKKYAMCAPVEDDGTYGAFYVKPYDTFNSKGVGFVGDYDVNTVPMKLQGNLYQRSGMNR
jgi:hypothetical protein